MSDAILGQGVEKAERAGDDKGLYICDWVRSPATGEKEGRILLYLNCSCLLARTESSVTIAASTLNASCAHLYS